MSMGMAFGGQCSWQRRVNRHVLCKMAAEGALNGLNELKCTCKHTESPLCNGAGLCRWSPPCPNTAKYAMVKQRADGQRIPTKLLITPKPTVMERLPYAYFLNACTGFAFEVRSHFRSRRTFEVDTLLYIPNYAYLLSPIMLVQPLE